MATSIKPAFDGQSLEEFFASFAYKGQGGRHDDSIRKRNSSRGGGGRVDQRIGQGQGSLSPNNNNNTPPPPPPSSSIQSTTNRKKTTMRTLPGILNGLSVAEFIASFAYKGRRVDNRIGKEEDLLNPGTPPPPPVKHGKRRKTSAAATTARRVSRFFPCPAERVDVKKDITGKGKAPLGSGTKTSAAATTARRVSRFFPCPDERVDVKKDITRKGKAPWGSGTTRKRPRTTGCTDANWQPQKCRGRRKRGSILLSAEEKYSDAYRRVSDDDICYAPRSSHNLLQERYCRDPWKVLVICILLNVTNGEQVQKVLPDFFLMCPDAKSVNNDLKEQIVAKLWSLGLQWRRAKLIIDFSKRYLADDWTHVTQLPGIGKYAADAYAIFAAGKLEQVKPQDHKLVEYWKEVGELLYRNS